MGSGYRQQRRQTIRTPSATGVARSPRQARERHAGHRPPNPQQPTLQITTPTDDVQVAQRDHLGGLIHVCAGAARPDRVYAPHRFELVGSVGPCPTDCSPLQVVEEPSSKFTSNCRTPPQAGTPNLLYGGGATCYRHAAAAQRARPNRFQDDPRAPVRRTQDNALIRDRQHRVAPYRR
jgi:hypothetical protein